MRKLTLNAEELEVQSFETADAEEGRGTVRANQETYRQWTCDGTCGGSCGAPDSCEPLYGWCGTYPEHGCPNSLWYCTDDVSIC
ncbi:MAG TPA: hypothetical protein VF092_22985 [Longimicrobium sp.]